MKNLYPIIQLMLRYSIGIGFLLPVLDRFGYFGGPDEANIVWGNWTNFVTYTYQLMPYTNIKLAAFFGIVATALELLFALLLLVGYKIRYAALGSFGLTLIFALSMMFFLHIRAPFNFSVFVVSFSSLILATFSNFPYSVDAYLAHQNQ